MHGNHFEDPARWRSPIGLRPLSVHFSAWPSRARYQIGPKNGTGTFWQRPAGRSHAAAAMVW
jgi:hypothetical protein